MEPFILFPFLSDIKSDIDMLHSSLKSAGLISLIAEPKLDQVISLSLLESSFIDNGISYKRIIVNDVQELSGHKDGLSIYFSKPLEIKNSVIFIEPRQITVNMGQNNSPRNGIIDMVIFSGCLALQIGGERINKLIPLIISGNWLSSNLDYTYDPVFTILRDTLEKMGIISVVSIVEVNDLDFLDLPGIDIIKLNELKKRWNMIDLSEQSEKLSEIVLSLLKSSLGVARLEELIWHRILQKEWDSDLASQCSRIQRELRSSDNKVRFAGELVDKIIKTGTLI